MYDSRIKFLYIDNETWTKQTDMIGKNVKNTAFNIVVFVHRLSTCKIIYYRKPLDQWSTFELCPSPEKLVKYVCFCDVIYKLEGIACIPALLKFIKRLRDCHYAGLTKNNVCSVCTLSDFIMTAVMLINCKNLICCIMCAI